MSKILCGDAAEVLKTLPQGSVNMCVTSPPYYGLRDYGIEGQIGIEQTPQEYIDRLVEVFAEVYRVLKPDGTLWLNISDSYAGSGKGPMSIQVAGNGKNKNLYDMKSCIYEVPKRWENIKPKDMIGIPWLLAFALRDFGYYLRSDIIWHKTNCLPESVKDRPSKSYEHIFLFAKSPKYYFDYKAIQEPIKEVTASRYKRGRSGKAKYSGAQVSQGIDRKTDAVTGWKARMNGRDISLKSNYSEIVSTKKTEIKIVDPRSNWKEWIKTIGVLQTYTSPYQILFRGKTISFAVKEENNELYIDIDGTICKKEPIFTKLLKNVFRKAAECVGCRECEADCHNGCLKIIDGKVNISDNCKHCAECHKVDNGCLIYKSLAMPKGGMGMSQKSLNCYSTHAPKMDWIAQYFKYKDEFDSNNDLGSQMFSFFKRFLRDADLLDNKGFSRTARIIERCGLDDLSAWGIMLANLAYTPQIGWFIKNFEFRENVSRNYAISRLMDDGTQERAANDIWRSYSRFIDLPFSEIGLGVPDKDNGKTVSFTRISWLNPEPKVILYALYKFSEACGNYKQFSLTRLLNHEIESDGISPTQIFGLDRTTMERILNGLSNNYPDFISVSFTLDLDNINLKDKTSDDVLSLFEGV